MTDQDLPPEDRKRILEEMADVLTEQEHSGDILRRFLPIEAHAHAMDPSTLLVVGERGAGKTALFNFLNAAAAVPGPLLSGLFSRRAIQLQVWEAFSGLNSEHPSTDNLVSFAADAKQAVLRRFWFGHLVGRLGLWVRRTGGNLPPEPFFSLWLQHRNEPECWVAEAGRLSGALQGWVDRLDASLTEPIVLSYDHLDRQRSPTSPDLPQRLAGELMSLWLSLGDRLRWVRGKIFLRRDLFDAGLRATTDASKLRSRAVPLEWTREDLFRVALRVLGTGARVREWLGREPYPIGLAPKDVLGWIPPYALPELGEQMLLFDHRQSATQEDFAEKLVGAQMGSGVNKGYTHRWIFNHTQDGHGRVVPRSLLNLLRFSALSALQRGSKARGYHLLTVSDLEAAQRETGEQRLLELDEEHPVTRRLQSLRGLEVPAVRSDVEARLSADPTQGEDGFGDNGARALETLVGLGALLLRVSGPDDEPRVDTPELIRQALGLKRRGGVRKRQD